MISLNKISSENYSMISINELSEWAERDLSTAANEITFSHLLRISTQPLSHLSSNVSLHLLENFQFFLCKRKRSKREFCFDRVTSHERINVASSDRSKFFIQIQVTLRY